jgi:MFS-type transporter involved in bile tolerance (Atg22 family)
MTVEKDRITGASRYSIEFAGRVSSLQFALSAAGMPLLGVFLDRRGLLASILALGNAIECAALVSLALLPPEFQALGTGVAKVLSNGALWPAVARLVPVSRYGFAFGLVVLAQNLAMTLGPPVSGALRDATGGYGAGMVLWAGVMVVATLAALVLRWDDRRRGSNRLERPAIVTS